MVKDNKLLIDTNVILRLLENKKSVVDVLRYYSRTHRILITDHSIFELLDHFDRVPNGDLEYPLALELLRQYDIDVIYHESSIFFGKIYRNFINGAFSIRDAKKLVLASFKFSMAGFLTNVYSLSILAIANSLENNYKSPFYYHIRHLYSNQKIDNDIHSYVNEMLAYGYDAGRIQIEKIIKCELRDLIIQVICYYDLFKSNKQTTEKRFREKYNFYDQMYAGKQFHEILKSYYKPHKLKIQNIDNINELSFQFISNYLENVARSVYGFSINDITDYLNFETAVRHNCLYYTLDNKSLGKIEKCFLNNDNVIQHINKARRIEKIPYNVII